MATNPNQMSGDGHAIQLFEDGYVSIALAAFKLCKNNGHQKAYDELGHVIDLLNEIRCDIRKTARINV